jgi:aminoglycoside phosphotransferase (APT) family kinase protein
MNIRKEPPAAVVALVRRLVDTQFPHWSDLPVTPVAQQGNDNRTFRLGDELSVRLPSAERYVAAVEKEQAWLPLLAPYLPLPIPVPVAHGQPGEGYEWPWSVNRWLPGGPASEGTTGDLADFARALAEFLSALQRIDAAGGPAAGTHSFFRGAPLEVYDVQTRQAITSLGSTIDANAAMRVWQKALSSNWDRTPVWFHGDVASTNLLLRNGRLGAVIDFGTCGVGDPACDLAIAWTFFDETSRAAFRERLVLDDETWARGRGWALWKALLVRARSKQEERSIWTHNPSTGRSIIEEATLR